MLVTAGYSLFNRRSAVGAFVCIEFQEILATVNLAATCASTGLFLHVKLISLMDSGVEVKVLLLHI